jgi:hypothetical protein
VFASPLLIEFVGTACHIAVGDDTICSSSVWLHSPGACLSSVGLHSHDDSDATLTGAVSALDERGLADFAQGEPLRFER